MSTTFGAQNGFALILTSKQYIGLWNKRYPDQRIENETDLLELHDDIRDYGDANCCDLYTQTPKDSPWLEGLAERMGDFGSAVNEMAENGDLDFHTRTVWAIFAPRPEDYFEAPYTDLNELVEDVIASSCLFDDTFKGVKEEDMRFVRDHIAYLSVVTFG